MNSEAFAYRPVTAGDVTLLVLDFQNDFAHPDGTYGRNDLGHVPVAAQEVLPNVLRAWEAARAARIPIVTAGLTILTDLDGTAIGIDQFRPALRRLFAREGFRSGSWGEQLIDELPQPDFHVRKWGHSAMYLTDMEKILRALDRQVLVIAGLGTNGVVEGTARDAVARGFEVVVLHDAVVAPDERLHLGALASLEHIGRLMSSDEFATTIGASEGSREREGVSA
jgi:ureidoacrylate peracid hydrolase